MIAGVTSSLAVVALIVLASLFLIKRHQKRKISFFTALDRDTRIGHGAGGIGFLDGEGMTEDLPLRRYHDHDRSLSGSGPGMGDGSHSPSLLRARASPTGSIFQEGLPGEGRRFVDPLLESAQVDLGGIVDGVMGPSREAGHERMWNSSGSGNTAYSGLPGGAGSPNQGGGHDPQPSSSTSQSFYYDPYHSRSASALLGEYPDPGGAVMVIGHSTSSLAVNNAAAASTQGTGVPSSSSAPALGMAPPPSLAALEPGRTASPPPLYTPSPLSAQSQRARRLEKAALHHPQSQAAIPIQRTRSSSLEQEVPRSPPAQRQQELPPNLQQIRQPQSPPRKHAQAQAQRTKPPSPIPPLLPPPAQGLPPAPQQSRTPPSPRQQARQPQASMKKGKRKPSPSASLATMPAPPVQEGSGLPAGAAPPRRAAPLESEMGGVGGVGGAGGALGTGGVGEDAVGREIGMTRTRTRSISPAKTNWLERSPKRGFKGL